MSATNPSSSVSDLAGKTKDAASQAAQSAKARLSRGKDALGKHCCTMEDANHELVMRHPGAMLTAAALAGLAIGCLVSGRTSR